MIHPENQIDVNDYAFVQERYGSIVDSEPCPVDSKTGKINPHVSRFKIHGKESVTSVFHIKPVYYETPEGAWRPLYEVTTHHGNRTIVFEYEKLGKVHPRYIEWLRKRCRLLGGDVFVTSPFTEKVFEYGSIVSSLHRMVAKPTVGLTTTTVYPDPDPETTTCDGIAWEETSTATWSTMRSAGGDSGYANAGTAGLRMFAIWADGSNYRQNGRSFVLFDTSSITDTDTIDSAVLSIYVYDKNDPASKAPDSQIYTATPASNTDIVGADYAQTGTTAQCDTAVTYASMTASAYSSWTFNATGRGNVSKTGVSKFSNKNANYDNANSAPGVTSADYYARSNGAEATGTTTDPKLVVTHTAGSTDVTASPAVLSATFSIPAPTVTGQQHITVSSSVLSATFSIPAPSVVVAVTVSPSPLTATFSIPQAEAITPDANVAPSPLTLTFSIPAPTISGDANVSASLLTATFSLPSSVITVTANITVSPSPLVLTLSIPTARVTGDVWQDKFTQPTTTWADKF